MALRPAKSIPKEKLGNDIAPRDASRSVVTRIRPLARPPEGGRDAMMSRTLTGASACSWRCRVATATARML
jgi:hypothetical protein